MKIILLGGSGTLGKELQKLNSDIFCPTHSHVDITYEGRVLEYLKMYRPDIVINAAAVLNNTPEEKAISTNIIGAANVALACIKLGIRLVYISTDYVYPGDKGNYFETDPLQPFNFYAWSKLGGECSSRGVKNHLIIRTSFGKSEFPYPHAFEDKWSSKDYVDRIAPMILEASLSDLTGVLNLGTERKTLFEYAKERNPNIFPIKVSESQFSSPKDTSLNLQKWTDFKTDSSVKLHTNCRVCGSSHLTKYLDLGNLPLVNNLANTKQEALDKERFPLQIMFCEQCGLSQLSVVIKPEKLYSYYTYRSSVNGGYVKHCKRMSDSLKLKGYLDSTSFVIDIAGNDGTLLKQFRQNSGCRILNVDPAKNLTEIAISEGIPSICDFWGTKLVKDLPEKADVITATNVFAHCDDITDFLQAVKLALKPKGVLVLEFPYLIDFIENLEFDTTYHEHLSYMSITPLKALCDKTGLKIVDVEKQEIHGGTVRVIISHNLASFQEFSRVMDFIFNEYNKGYNKVGKYKYWEVAINNLLIDLSSNLYHLKKEGYKIAAFAASAKGNTLLNSARKGSNTIDYIVDQTPEKIGKFSPGTGIPILDITELTQNPPDFLLILAWNFLDEIIDKCRKNGYKGKFIVPIPKFKIID